MEDLTPRLGCNPTPTCVRSCVDYSDTLIDCRAEYVALMDCASEEMSTEACYCAGNDDGGVLACDLCFAIRQAFRDCRNGL